MKFEMSRSVDWYHSVEFNVDDIYNDAITSNQPHVYNFKVYLL